MDGVLAAPLGAFLFITLFVFGGCAFMTGQSLADGWKSERSVLAYTLLLAVGDRFLIYALAGGSLFSLYGLLLHGVVLGLITLAAFRMARARRMVNQYPWLYDRAGPFGWRERSGGGF